jgi:formate/nitrite transporter FocA (FNT family)
MCFFSSVKSSDGTKAAAICFQQYGLSQAIALLPVAYRAKRITGRQLLANLGWVYLGNLLGSVCYGGMFALTLSLSSAPQTTIGPLLIVAAEAKTIAYAHMVLVASWSAWSKLCFAIGWFAWALLPP